MASYEGNHHLRVGSKNNGVQIVTTVRKLAVFKGLAISEGSSSPSITDVLDCKIALNSRPRLSKILVTTTPACTDLYAYYTMQPSSLANTNQQVSDTSGSALNAVNGPQMQQSQLTQPGGVT